MGSKVVNKDKQKMITKEKNDHQNKTENSVTGYKEHRGGRMELNTSYNSKHKQKLDLKK